MLGNATRPRTSLPPPADSGSPRPPNPAQKPLRTVRNGFKWGLKRLSSLVTAAISPLVIIVKGGEPIAAMVSSIIDPLLAIMERIEQTSDNQQGLNALAARIRVLTPIVSDLAKSNSIQGQLRQLDQFFNSTHNASSLAKHNTILAQMIADSTLVTVHEVLKTVQELEHSKILQSSQPIEIIERADITGGLGGPGGRGETGGQGGDGEGPQLAIRSDELWKLGNVSGEFLSGTLELGTGGTDGEGIEIGGKGGTGTAPVISFSSVSIHIRGIRPLKDVGLEKEIDC
ncbi:hypothetical protein C8R44DRAFT_796790 [Mycena epipterygia]|nr:hypothetical protein C8R44DRAFT_796790 [Mycena epipterygia]